MPLHAVLDLGANRGLFCLIALSVLEADIVLAVEPSEFHKPTLRLIIDANAYSESRVILYNRFVADSSEEHRDHTKSISVGRIRKEQKIDRFALVKVDIEGSEREIFGEPQWLAHVDNIAMEVHHSLAGNLEMIPYALDHYGFQYIATDQFGRDCRFEDAMYLYASCTGSLRY